MKKVIFFSGDNLKIIKESQDQYRKINKLVSTIYDTLLMNICNYSNNSLSIEITGKSCGSLDWYLNEIFPLYNENGYEIHVIYPIVFNVETLIERSVCRSDVEGRYIDPMFIYEAAKNACTCIKFIKNSPYVTSLRIYDGTKPMPIHPIPMTFLYEHKKIDIGIFPDVSQITCINRSPP